MATDDQQGTDTEQGGTQSNDQQQQTTPEPGANGSQQQATPNAETRLPDDHPLVKAFAALKAENANLKGTKAEADKVPGLSSELATAKAEAEKVPSLEKRGTRLEAFLQELGGPVAQILDSRTYSERLFNTDDSIADIVKDWHKAHPSQTSQALGGGSSQQQGKPKTDINAAIRAAAGKP